MFKIYFLLLISLSLYGGEVVWSSEASQSVSGAELQQAIKEHVAQKYPKELEAWEKEQEVKRQKEKRQKEKRQKEIAAQSVTLGDLMWQDDEDTKTVQKKWDDAQMYCNNLQLLGFNDWRLPTKSELESIVDRSRKPAIKKEFKSTGSNVYWNVTTYEGYKYFAWVVDFADGSVNGNFKDGNLYVRCVRGGQ